MTTEAKHTPGPWTAIKASHGPIDIFDANDRDVVTVYGGGVPEDREVNARLIAAAPDLLAALEFIRAEFDRWAAIRGGMGTYSEAAEKIDAALAKARGA